MKHPSEAESIGDLAGQLVADGKAYVSAEANIYRQKALAWMPPVKMAAIFIVLAIFVAQAAMTTLLVFVGFLLALWLGPLGGGIAAAAIGFSIAGLLAYLAVRQFGGKAK